MADSGGRGTAAVGLIETSTLGIDRPDNPRHAGLPPVHPQCANGTEKHLWQTVKERLFDEDALLASVGVADREKDHEAHTSRTFARMLE